MNAADLYTLYAREGSVHRVGKIVGLSGDTVHQRLKKAGYPLDRQNWSQAELSALTSYYADTPDDAFSLEAAVALIGRHRMAVALKASELGLCNASRKTNASVIAKFEEISRGRWDRHPHPRGMLGKPQSEKAKLAVSRASKARWLLDKTFFIGHMSEANRQRRSDAMVARQADPKSGVRRGGVTRTNYGRRVDLGNMFFRSSWEANYARYLNTLILSGEIVRWEFEPDTFWFEAIRRGVRSYLPDFKVWPAGDGAHYYVEVKGWMDAKSKTKLKRMKKYHPTVALKLCGAKQYKILDRRFRDVIPGWEGGSVPWVAPDPDDLGAVALDELGAQSAPVPMEEMRC